MSEARSVGEAIAAEFKRLSTVGMPTDQFWTEIGAIAIKRLDWIRSVASKGPEAPVSSPQVEEISSELPAAGTENA